MTLEKYGNNDKGVKVDIYTFMETTECIIKHWRPGKKTMMIFCLDTVTYFLIKLGMNLSTHLVDISIFSLNNVIIWLTKIMNNLLKYIKILIFKVISSIENRSNHSKKKFLWSMINKDTNFYKKHFLKILTLKKKLYFLKTSHYFVKKFLLPLDTCEISCPTWSKNLWRYLLLAPQLTLYRTHSYIPISFFFAYILFTLFYWLYKCLHFASFFALYILFYVRTFCLKTETDGNTSDLYILINMNFSFYHALHIAN